MTKRMARISSSSVIHGMYCRPDPSLPPMPALTIGTSRASRPPPRASTRPVRRWLTTMPASTAGRRGALPPHADVGQERVAGRGVLGDRGVAGVAVVADCRGADEPRRGLRRRPSARATVPTLSTRLDTIVRLYASVQRLSPTPAPDRQTTTSTPSSTPGSSRPCAGSHRSSSGPRARAGRACARSALRRRASRAGRPDQTGRPGEHDLHADSTTPACRPDCAAVSHRARTRQRRGREPARTRPPRAAA